VELSDFLVATLFDSIGEYLRRYKSEMSEPQKRESLNSTGDKLERAQMALAMKQLTQYIRQSLGGRLYLDVSERTTDVLLPRSLELWDSAVDLIEDEGDFLESPEKHREEIKTFRESIVPRLKKLQESQHLLREFGTVIAAQKDGIEKLDREELVRLAAEQGISTGPPSEVSSNRGTLITVNVVVTGIVLVFFGIRRWRRT
jgi:hypothetical protein